MQRDAVRCYERQPDGSEMYVPHDAVHMECAKCQNTIANAVLYHAAHESARSLRVF